MKHRAYSKYKDSTHLAYNRASWIAKKNVMQAKNHFKVKLNPIIKKIRNRSTPMFAAKAKRESTWDLGWMRLAILFPTVNTWRR